MKLSKPVMALAGLAGLLCGAVRLAHREPEPTRRDLLAASLKDASPIDGFLTGLPLPFQQAARSRSAIGGEASGIVRSIQEAAERDGSPESLSDQAAVELLSGHPDKAVSLLEQASRLAPKDARILSDLSAAYLVRSETPEGTFASVNLALSKAKQALAQNPQLREALCNRALALEKLGLPAMKAWKSCWEAYDGTEQRELASRLLRLRPAPRLRLDLKEAARSGNVEEVREIVSVFPRKAREVGEEEVASWASAYLKGEHAKAAASLLVARVIGDALAETSGDGMLRDLVLSLSRQRQPRLERHARGLDGYWKGLTLYEKKDRYEQASDVLSGALEDLAAVSSPYQVRASYWLALSEKEQGRQEDALEALRSVARRADRSGYGMLLAESFWMIGMTESELGNPEAASKAYQSSIVEFEKSRDIEGLAGARNVFAELLDEMGASVEAWRTRQATLAEVDRIESPKRLYQVHSVPAMAAFGEGLPEVAVEFQAEALRHAPKVNTMAMSQALFWQARYCQASGDSHGAREYLRQARQWVAKLTDKTARDRAESDIFLAEAEAKLSGSPQEAVELLAEALLRFSRINHQSLRFEALLLRARAYRALGQRDQSEADLREAIGIVENLRQRIDRNEFKISYLDGVQEVYDEMILLQTESKDPEAALDFLERKRARVLLDRLLALPGSGKKLANEPAPPPLPVREWAARLPERTVFLSYARVRDQLLVWAVDQSGVLKFQSLGQASDIEAPAGKIRSAARRERVPREEIEAATEELYDRLIRPIQGVLPNGYYLAISRDDLLSGIPFSLFLDRETGRYLIEDHPILIAPSANSYLASLRRSAALEAEQKALFVGDPGFDRKAFPDLDPLPAARKEAEKAASLYGPDADVLLEDAATEEAVRESLERFGLVQLSTHAVVNERAPLYSGLLLTPAPGNDGVLHAHEIYGMHFDRTSLVILAACGSSEGPSSRSEGVESLSRAFLYAGVPSVVGTLWDIEDSANSRLLLDFHRNLRRGQDAASALQAAQIGILRSETKTWRSPLVWAAFELIGSAAKPAP